MREYGECRPVGDKDAGASSPEGEKGLCSISFFFFFFTDRAAFHHEKLLLVAKQCTVGSIKPLNIAPRKLSCQISLGVRETMQHGFNRLSGDVRAAGCDDNTDGPRPL